jgi:NitT/TauT family transport system substrate-binding protein
MRAAGAAVLVVAAFVVGPAVAQAPAGLLPIRFATVGNLGTLHASYTIARSQGLFAKQGLDVQFVPLDASPAALAAVAAGSVQFAFTGPNIVDAVVAGLPLVVIQASANVPVSEVCAAREIMSPRDLAGKTIATTNRGSALDVTLRIWLERQGVDPDLLTIRNVDAGIPAIVAAAQAGAAQAFVLNPPHCFRYTQSGFHVLADLGALGLQFFGAGIAVNRDYLAGNRAVIRRFLTAVVQGRALFQADRNLAIATIKAGDRIDDQETAENVWEFFKAHLANPPLVSRDAMATAVQFSLSRQTRELGPDLIGRMYDNSVLEEALAP